MKIVIKKIISLLLAILMIFSTSNPTVYASSRETQQMGSSEKEILNLFDQRAELLNQLFQNQHTISKKATTINSLNIIDMQLMQKGVKFLSQDDVLNIHPEIKNIKELSIPKESSYKKGASRLVALPESNVNSWATYRTAYSYGGETYNIQRLVAQPASDKSPLFNIGSRTITFNNNWKAGSVDALTTLAEAGLGAATSEIPGTGVVLTLYDAIKSFVTGISKTTEVTVPHIVYSWSNITTASFVYVRKGGQTDDEQWLSLIETKTSTVVGYQMPTFNYKNSSGQWVLNPRVARGDRTINATPVHYNSNSFAILAYNSSSNGTPIQNCVEYIKISGPESKLVEKIYPCYPSHPGLCE